tara:strand:+ start:32 stop:217 length:186 start_codon:yes stop_codon:yes gene_type:complete
MKVGDLVKWKASEPASAPGIVLKTKPTKGAAQGTAVLAYIPECPDPEWFHESELEVVSESR